jgi:hypothetical protein
VLRVDHRPGELCAGCTRHQQNNTRNGLRFGSYATTKFLRSAFAASRETRASSAKSVSLPHPVSPSHARELGLAKGKK